MIESIFFGFATSHALKGHRWRALALAAIGSWALAYNFWFGMGLWQLVPVAAMVGVVGLLHRWPIRYLRPFAIAGVLYLGTIAESGGPLEFSREVVTHVKAGYEAGGRR